MDSYTFEELREFGCPDGLLIQYYFCTKKEIDALLKKEDTTTCVTND
jgi:hypothetical protein